ncbi:MAG: ChbG/HpnK family deacetylase [Lachnospiraceae bacterium]|nr:ChbG/HpnK family deacetylase [Lachnospiraceae bacterium]
MSFLVNADDFGKNENVTGAVLEAFERGYINFTTLMTNMPYAQTAAHLAFEKGVENNIGLHLNITEGEPLSEGIKSNPLICSSDGRFNAAFYHNLKYRLYMDELTITQIMEEFRAQIDKFLSFGFTALHIDSHHHVHTNYPVYVALKRLSVDHHFDYIRLSRNMYHGGNILNRIYKKLYNRDIVKICERTCDLFGSYQDLLSYIDNDKEKLSELLKSRSAEIMVHPDRDDNGVLIDRGQVVIPMDEEWAIQCID